MQIARQHAPSPTAGWQPPTLVDHHGHDPARVAAALLHVVEEGLRGRVKDASVRPVRLPVRRLDRALHLRRVRHGDAHDLEARLHLLAHERARGREEHDLALREPPAGEGKSGAVRDVQHACEAGSDTHTHSRWRQREAILKSNQISIKSASTQVATETPFSQGASPRAHNCTWTPPAPVEVKHDDRSDEGLAKARGQGHLQCGGSEAQSWWCEGAVAPVPASRSGDEQACGSPQGVGTGQRD